MEGSGQPEVPQLVPSCYETGIQVSAPQAATFGGYLSLESREGEEREDRTGRTLSLIGRERRGGEKRQKPRLLA